MLLDHGNCTVHEQWKVLENSTTGFTRVYYVHYSDVIYSDVYGDKKLEKGHLYLLPTSSPYSCTKGEIGFCCTYLHMFIPNFITTKLLDFNIEQDPFLIKLIELIELAIKNDYNDIIESLCSSLEIYILSKNIISDVPECISKSLKYIAENIFENITVESLAQQYGYNCQYYNRLFKKHVGYSPYQFIEKLRFHSSLKFLKQNYSISQVAQIVGYKDIKIFSRAFKNTFGIAPSKYRDHISLIP